MLALRGNRADRRIPGSVSDGAVLGALGWLVLGVAGAIVLAGCATPGSPPADPAVSEGDGGTDLWLPPPRHGAEYEYESPEGRKLTLGVGDWVKRKDAWLNERTVLALAVTYEHDGHVFSMEETVLPSTGGIVQQWSPCSWKDRKDPSQCGDEAGQVFTGSQGLPGALGAGPFWNQTLRGSNATISLDTPLLGNENWSYNLSEPNQGLSRGPCRSLAVVDGMHSGSIAGLQFTAQPAGLTLCDGLAFPLSFTSLTGTAYRLVQVEEGDGPRVELRRRAAGSQPAASMGLGERSFPVYVAHPTFETNFSAREAHRVAMNRSEAYSGLFDRGENATVVYSDYGVGPSRTRGIPGGPSSHTYEQVLNAVDKTGRWVKVALNKTVRDPAGPADSQVTYEVGAEEEGRTSATVSTRESLAPQGVRVDEAVELGEELTGQPWDSDVGFGLWRSIPDQGFVEGLSEWRTRSSSINIWYEDPNPNRDGGLAVSTPYQFAMDRATGAVLGVYADRDTLNRTMR